MSRAMGVAFLNGTYLDPAQAQVPVLDRGFLYGDGVYELIPVFGGCPLALERHLDRLSRSLAAVRCPDPLTRETWREMIARLIERNGKGQMALYIQVTRGATPGRDHRFPDAPAPTVFAMCMPMTGPSAQSLAAGVDAITQPDLRWARCDIKATSLLGNVLARQAAAEAGADEAILLRDGVLTEGSSSAVLLGSGGGVATTPDGPQILPSVTRDVLAGLARAAGVSWTVRQITEAELRGAAEIMIASSARGVLAVTRLDGAPVGEGRPGPLWRRLHKLFVSHLRQLEALPA